MNGVNGHTFFVLFGTCKGLTKGTVVILCLFVFHPSRQFVIRFPQQLFLSFCSVRFAPFCSEFSWLLEIPNGSQCPWQKFLHRTQICCLLFHFRTFVCSGSFVLLNSYRERLCRSQMRRHSSFPSTYQNNRPKTRVPRLWRQVSHFWSVGATIARKMSLTKKVCYAVPSIPLDRSSLF